jgi:hypothetical protein
MLHASGETTYANEPLNVWRYSRPLRRRTEGWPGYPYVTAENEEAYLPVLTDLIGLKADVFGELSSVRSHRDLSCLVSTWATFLIGRAMDRRPLIKEPHAFFLAPWFVDRLGGQVVITVRHPAAVVSSWKRLCWPVDFGQLLGQPLLLREWLRPYEAEMIALRSSNDLVENVSLLWTMVYDFVARTRNGSDSIHVVRHEDLSDRPVETYQKIYSALGLGFTHRAKRAVLRASATRNPKELPLERPYAVRLDSRANLENWKERLTSDEIERIREITVRIARLYYSDESWE